MVGCVGVGVWVFWVFCVCLCVCVVCCGRVARLWVCAGGGGARVVGGSVSWVVGCAVVCTSNNNVNTQKKRRRKRKRERNPIPPQKIYIYPIIYNI